MMKKMEHVRFFGFALGSHEFAPLFQKHFLKKLKISIAHLYGFLLSHIKLLLCELHCDKYRFKLSFFLQKEQLK